MFHVHATGIIKHCVIPTKRIKLIKAASGAHVKALLQWISENCVILSHFSWHLRQCLMQMMFSSDINRTHAIGFKNQPLSIHSPKTNRSIFTVSPKSMLSFHFPVLAIFSHCTFCLTPSGQLPCLLKLTHTLLLTHTHTHTHSALACESCEGLRLAFSIWLCFCSMCERSE